MPYIPRSPHSGVRYHYELYGDGDEKILMLMGFACCKSYWEPQVELVLKQGGRAPMWRNAGATTAAKEPAETREENASAEAPHASAAAPHATAPASAASAASDAARGSPADDRHPPRTRYQICVFDTRGFGLSSMGDLTNLFTTTSMAYDALYILAHLGWIAPRTSSSHSNSNASSSPPSALPILHLVAWSLGGMISQHVGMMLAMPDCPFDHRLTSIVLTSTSMGGMRTLPVLPASASSATSTSASSASATPSSRSPVPSRSPSPSPSPPSPPPSAPSAPVRPISSLISPITYSTFLPRNLPPLHGIYRIAHIIFGTVRSHVRIHHALLLHFSERFLATPYSGIWSHTMHHKFDMNSRWRNACICVTPCALDALQGAKTTLVDGQEDGQQEDGQESPLPNQVVVDELVVDKVVVDVEHRAAMMTPPLPTPPLPSALAHAAVPTALVPTAPSSASSASSPSPPSPPVMTSSPTPSASTTTTTTTTMTTMSTTHVSPRCTTTSVVSTLLKSPPRSPSTPPPASSAQSQSLAAHVTEPHRVHRSSASLLRIITATNSPAATSALPPSDRRSSLRLNVETSPHSSSAVDGDDDDCDDAGDDSDSDDSDFELQAHLLTSPVAAQPPRSQRYSNRHLLSHLYAQRSPFNRPIWYSLYALLMHNYAVFTHYAPHDQLSLLAEFHPLVLTGTHDLLVHASNSLVLAHALRCPCVCVENGGHVIYVEEPQLFAAILHRHFRRSVACARRNTAAHHRHHQQERDEQHVQQPTTSTSSSSPRSRFMAHRDCTSSPTASSASLSQLAAATARDEHEDLMHALVGIKHHERIVIVDYSNVPPADPSRSPWYRRLARLYQPLFARVFRFALALLFALWVARRVRATVAWGLPIVSEFVAQAWLRLHERGARAWLSR